MYEASKVAAARTTGDLLQVKVGSIELFEKRAYLH